MTGYIGCAGLVAIAVFIVLLALWRRKSDKEVGQFYQTNSLFKADDAPQNVREMIGAPNAICLQGNVKFASGEVVPFFWWEWFVSSTTFVNNSAHSSVSCFLAVSFPPNVVSAEFEQKAIPAKQTKSSFFQKLKNALGLNTKTPIRIEKLTDGTFVIFWQVLQRAKILQDKIDWLKDNLPDRSSKSSRDSNKNTMNSNFVSADVNLTLMMMDQNGDFAPSDIMTFKYFFAAPDAFAANLAENSRDLMNRIYNEHYQTFKLSEPNDPNYIAVVDVVPAILRPEEYAATPWLGTKVPAWESSNCIVVKDVGFQKVDPNRFGGYPVVTN